MLLNQRHRSSIQTSQESFLSELEVDRIITSCNLSLAKVTGENDELKSSIQDSRTQIDFFQKTQSKEERQFRTLKTQIDDYEYIQNIKKDVLSKIKLITNKMDNLENYLKELQNITQQIEQSPMMWKCIRCGIKQKEGENEESCVYHPGKLMYFSCRLCGQDEYFTCCNRCRECLPGCKKGLHKP